MVHFVKATIVLSKFLSKRMLRESKGERKGYDVWTSVDNLNKVYKELPAASSPPYLRRMSILPETVSVEPECVETVAVESEDVGKNMKNFFLKTLLIHLLFAAAVRNICSVLPYQETEG